MRKILVLLLFPALASAQVTLPDNVARFYFERHYIAKIQVEQLSIKDQTILNLKKQLDQKDELIYSYFESSEQYRELVKLRDTEKAVLQKDLRAAYREVTKQKIQKKIVIVGCIILTVLIAR